MKKILVYLMIAGLLLGFWELISKKNDKDNSNHNKSYSKRIDVRKDIGIISLNGEISFSERSSFFDGSSSAGKLISDLKYFTNTGIKAVIIRINSPGGSVGAVQEICYAMEKLKKSGTKIICSFKDISASGGYYMSCYADSIVCNPGALTGSIGVIMSMPNLSGLFEKLGVKYNTVKSGKYKDIGNISREMLDDEKSLLQGSVDDSYEQFVEAVMKGRGLTLEEVKEIADGRIFTGRQAHKLKLVDHLGGFDKAIEVAKKMGNIKVKEKLIYPDKKQNFMDIINEFTY